MADNVEMIEVRVTAGTLLPLGDARVSPGGVLWKSGVVAWHNVKSIGADEMRIETSITGAAIGAIGLGVVASLFAGPLGIAATAAVGGALNAFTRSETFEIWALDGQFATVEAAAGTMQKARTWREGALQVAAVASLDPRAAIVAEPEKPNPKRLLGFWRS